MNTTIRINNRDLAYTIDTYGMFNGESVEENEAEYYQTEYKLTEDEWRNLGFDYDHRGIVADLASASVNILSNELSGDPVVKNISLPVETRSPKFYNYTTDSYDADWTIDIDELLKFANQNQSEFGKHIQDEWHEFVNVPEHITAEYLQSDSDKYLVAMLDLYLRSKVDPESYEMQMFECESEAYFNNMQLDAESQKLIDSKEGNN